MLDEKTDIFFVNSRKFFQLNKIHTPLSGLQLGNI